MNSASVDLIYLDPPFNSNHNYAAPIGSKAAGAAFKDTWTLSDVDVQWINLIEAKHPSLHRVLLASLTDSDKSYLAYMAVRLLEIHRVLKPTGSVYLHCDPTMSHYLKLVMDAIFGRKNFQNEVIWHYSTFHGSKQNYKRNYDQILYFSKSQKERVFNWQSIAEPYHPLTVRRFDKMDEEGRRYKIVKGRRCYEGIGTPPNACVFIPQLQVNSREHTGYPTQKPLALLTRFLRASSNPGDVILDPFCGCATACIAAAQTDRRWVGIDIAPKAAELVVRRMREEVPLLTEKAIHRQDIPQRTDLGKVIAYNDARNKRHLYGEQGGCCSGCGEHFRLHNLEVDHIVPRAKGGTDHLGNLQLLCGHCNRVKGDRGMEYLRAKLHIAA